MNANLISKEELSELLDSMIDGECVEIITGDYIEKVTNNCFELNFGNQGFTKNDLISNVVEVEPE